ncbi:MAG: cobalamin 5'-phosphate synthase [Candidatus Lambdaproteobacteria bacterium RIFOXYD1_FULL_56_27]|uniref:Adenosylcobinamide-GDP ribazoletransferase n=1 Tax=Candidatus Lambdaproteobacteria bacterium RIFOXYD2_FULL_56_26 TaxID=1817773 RepID=A0A1F6H3Q0_9PROT|nr:MAG: cobalamin 5'-phosphate synthase [Candidatus Lambdaproteobacteria bacterium RIFOXYC1_FULL_56_13]OGH04995.1 MAG: cobalamin 5'-phosphate synthase [Candidatus Lambdaproteobacteria bacterium RIFOXYD2_FULL_56_26]OGH09460.1 MAG: cobalamin 5'-phosphate synthase [Candidatus Lambdaproteobacteria bacterium RIFOXYD1_FULL_56_27]
MFRALITAIRTLTLFPVPGKDTERFPLALYAFPLVGALLGGILVVLGLVFEALPWHPWVRGEAVFLALALVILTRGLHWDGLADWADSLGAGTNREKALAILKDPHTGAFGALALVFVALAWVELAAQLVTTRGLWWLAGVLVITRSLQVELICFYPYARQEGMAGPFIEGAGKGQRLSAVLLGLALTYPLFGPMAFAAYGLGFLTTHGFGLTQSKRLGGITGDLIGASNLLNELVLLGLGILYPPTYFVWRLW